MSLIDYVRQNSDLSDQEIVDSLSEMVAYSTQLTLAGIGQALLAKTGSVQAWVEIYSALDGTSAGRCLLDTIRSQDSYGGAPMHSAELQAQWDAAASLLIISSEQASLLKSLGLQTVAHLASIDPETTVEDVATARLEAANQDALSQLFGTIVNDILNPAVANNMDVATVKAAIAAQLGA